MRNINTFDKFFEDDNYGGEEFHKDDFGANGWDAIKKKLYVGSREEDESIDWVIDLMKDQGYSVPTRNYPTPINTKGDYPGATKI